MSKGTPQRRSLLEAMTVKDLKEVLRDLGLKVSGKKADLVDRILDFAGQSEDSEPEEEEALLLDDDEDEPLAAEVLEAEVIAAEVVEDEPLTLDDGEDEPLEAEVLEAEIFEAEILDDEPPAISQPRLSRPKLATPNILSLMASPAFLVGIIVLLLMSAAVYWYVANRLEPFIAEPVEYGDSMDFTISSGSFEVEGEEMIRRVDELSGGALAQVCEQLQVSFTGSGHVSVSKGGSTELLDPSDTHHIGAVQAQGPYGLNYLTVEQRLEHNLAATFSGKTQDPLDKCTTSFERSGYELSQTTNSYKELVSQDIKRSESDVELDYQGEITRVDTVSFGTPTSALGDVVPDVLLPLMPVELHTLFKNELLTPSATGSTESGWTWQVLNTVTVDGKLGLNVVMQNSKVEDCIGRAHITMKIVPDYPWPVEQRVDISLEKSRYDSPNCGDWQEYLLDQTLPDGAIKLQYTLVRTGGSNGENHIGWGGGYNLRPSDTGGALDADREWGASGTHMPDESQARDWTLDEAVLCIINQTVQATEAATSLASGGYVFQASDDRTNSMTRWNVSWVDDNEAGWVIVEQRSDGNCSVIDDAMYSEDDRPAHRRESIPATATLAELEARITDSTRYAELTADITSDGKFRDDTSFSYLLTVPPEADDIFDVLEGLQDGTVVVSGQREWSSGGFDHNLNYAMDGETGRMAGWIVISSNST